MDYIELAMHIIVILWLAFIVNQISANGEEMQEIDKNIKPLTKIQVRAFLGIQVIVLIWVCCIEFDMKILEHLLVLYITWTIYTDGVYEDFEN